MLRRPRPRHTHRRPALSALLAAPVADGPRLRRHNARRPGHRPARAQLLRPTEPDRPADGGLHERRLERPAAVCRPGPAAGRGLPEREELQGAQGPAEGERLPRRPQRRRPDGSCWGVCV
ncbi:hypothetical protein VTH06DRAFT_5241, partial [Thermothelomyces fergusii]